MTDQPTGTGMPGLNAASGPRQSWPVSASGSSATTKAVSIAPPKPRGFFNKVLHGIGKGLKVAGETIIEIALSGLAAADE